MSLLGIWTGGRNNLNWETEIDFEKFYIQELSTFFLQILASILACVLFEMS